MSYELPSIALPDLQDTSKEGVAEYLRILNQAISERDEEIKNRIGRLDSLFDVRDFGAIGDGVADDTAAILAAISALPVQGGVVKFGEGDFRHDGEITIPTNVRFEGVTIGSTFLTQESTSANGLVLSTEGADYIIIRNMTIRCNTTSSGTGILSDGTVTCRDPLIENVYVDQYKVGIAIASGINGWINKTRVTGQGKTVASSVGIKLYEGVSGSTTTFGLNKCYVAGFETNFSFYSGPHTLIGPVSGASDIHFHSLGTVIIYDPWAENIDTGADKVFKTTVGTLSLYGWQKMTAIGGGSVTASTYPAVVFDYDETGKEASTFSMMERTHIRAFLSASNQTITTGTDTKLTLDGESYDRQSEFGSSRFTATKPRGWYLVTIQVNWASAQDSWIAIYVDGAAVAQQIEATGELYMRVTDIVKLDVGSYVEAYVRQNSGGDIDINKGSAKTFMSISELI
jgi:hypothetical protein